MKKKFDIDYQEPIAIIGMSCIFPKAQSLGEYWSNIKKKVDAITEVPPSHWNPEHYYDSNPKASDRTYSKHGGFLSPVDFNPSQYGISPADLEAIDTSQLLGLVTAQAAMIDAGYGLNRQFDRSKISVILGLTGTLELVIPLGARLGHPIWRAAMQHAGVEDSIINDVIHNIGQAYVSWQENSFPGLLGNVAAGRIANRFDFGGTNCVVDAACGSALSAVHLAALELQSGQADMVITGGVDTFNDIFMYMCFSKTPALSPSGHARPFSADSDGTTLGEGVGMVVLKRLTAAQAAGDNIYATIKSLSTSSDGKGKAIYAPSPDGQIRALRRSYESAKIEPPQIGYIEAHGTGTKVGDQIEISALNEVFGKYATDRPWCAVGSVKSQIGHTKAAAGAAGLIKAVMALKHKVIPPTIKINEPAQAFLSETCPFYPAVEKRPWFSAKTKPRLAGVSSFGFGGSNYHAVVEEFGHLKTETDWDDKTHIIAFSAGTRDDLTRRVGDFVKQQTGSDTPFDFATAMTRRNFSSEDQVKLTLATDGTRDKCLEILKSAVDKINQNPDQESFSSPDGITFHQGDKPGLAAMVFPGQGAQYLNMGLDAACIFPEAFDSIAFADETIGKAHASGMTLSDCIFPTPTWSPEKTGRLENILRETQVAQPALGAVAIAGYEIIRRFGLRPDGFIGHSYGELAALHAAGAFDRKTLIELSRKRGEFMAREGGEKGGMLAVSTDPETVKRIITEERLNLTAANYNAPQQLVLSGKSEEIARAAECMKKRKIRATVLSVAAAFHSPLVAHAAEPFKAALQKYEIHAPKLPVYANTTSEPYPADPEKVRDLLGKQLLNPVRFVESISSMYESGFRVFIETGPGARMTGLIDAILADKPHHAFSADTGSAKKSGILQIARTLARLAACGFNIDLKQWNDGEALLNRPVETLKSKLTYKICGANYRSPKSKQPPKVDIPKTTRMPIPAQNVKAVHTTTVPVAESRSPLPANAGNTINTPMTHTTFGDSGLVIETLGALQKIQMQTAELHKQFLEGQEQAHKSIQMLIDRHFAPSATIDSKRAQAPLAQPQTHMQQPLQTRAEPAIRSHIAETTTAPKPSTVPHPAGIEQVLMQSVCDKTGYPMEMINLDMDMEADLGIDSIKRVEIMSGLQEKMPGLPSIQPDKLGQFKTLRNVIDFLSAGKQETTGTPAPKQGKQLKSVLLEVVAEKTGYPVEMINLDMDMESDLGIDSIKRVEIMSALQERFPGSTPMQPEQLSKLRTLNQIIENLDSPQDDTQRQMPTNSSGESITNTLLEIVAEKTGYPVEMLNLDMDMEGDLGIDSIKRVEIMSAMQEKSPDAPVIQPAQLSTLKTLRQILDFIGINNDTLQNVTSQPVCNKNNDQMRKTLLEIVSDKTGYPADMLNPEMEMESDLGIDSIKRVEILSAFQERIPGAPVIQPGDLGKFRTLNQIFEFLSGSAGGKSTPSHPENSAALTDQQNQIPLQETAALLCSVPQAVLIKDPSARKRIADPASRIVIIGDETLSSKVATELKERGFEAATLPLTPETAELPDNFSGLVVIFPHSADDKRETPTALLWSETSEALLKSAFFTIQKAGETLKRNSGTGAFLVTVSQMDGRFGLAADNFEFDPVSGGLAGLAKTAAREWTSLNVKAVDLALKLERDSAAKRIVDEVFAIGPIEVGLDDAGTWEITETAVDTQACATGCKAPWEPGEALLITGGARGVTAEAAVALAKYGSPHLILLGRSPEPVEEPASMAHVTGEKALKEAILAESGSNKPGIKELEARYRAIQSGREITSNLNRIRSAGARCTYISADVRDRKSLKSVMARIRNEFGPVRGLIHGAGVLRDKRIEGKTRAQFDDVFDTKVAGLRNIFECIQPDELRAMVFFSSITARQGRIGQIDYAAANEVLNKAACKFRGLRKDCRVISFNWGPWDGGMVTDALKNVFLTEGIGLIPLDKGAQLIQTELATERRHSVELVAYAQLPSQAPRVKPDSSVIPDVSENHTESGTGARFYLAFDRKIGTKTDKYLCDHVINGAPVLPTTMITEFLIHGALLENPGYSFHGLDDLRIQKGAVLDQTEPYQIAVYTTRISGNAEFPAVSVELRNCDNKPITHAKATVILAHKLPPPPQADLAPNLNMEFRHSTKEIYSKMLFHGPLLEGIQSVKGWSENGICAEATFAPPPEKWMSNPPRSEWLTDPLILDSAYQLMILWTTQALGDPSLPTYARRYRQYRSAFPKELVRIAAVARKSGPQTAFADIEFIDKHGKLIARMDGYECVINPSLRQAFEKRSIQENLSA